MVHPVISKQMGVLLALPVEEVGVAVQDLHGRASQCLPSRLAIRGRLCYHDRTMNLEQNRYARFQLVREMLETPRIIRGFDPSTIGRLALLAVLVTLGLVVYAAALDILGVAKLRQLIASLRRQD